MRELDTLIGLQLWLGFFDDTIRGDVISEADRRWPTMI